MNLFSTLTCCYCGEGHFSPRNPSLFNGFRDGDTNQVVCSQCRDHHYKEKALPDGSGTYSEIPIPYAQMQYL